MIPKCAPGINKSALMRLVVIQLLGLVLTALIVGFLVKVPENVEVDNWRSATPQVKHG